MIGWVVGLVVVVVWYAAPKTVVVDGALTVEKEGLI